MFSLCFIVDLLSFFSTVYNFGSYQPVEKHLAISTVVFVEIEAELTALVTSIS